MGSVQELRADQHRKSTGMNIDLAAIAGVDQTPPAKGAVEDRYRKERAAGFPSPFAFAESKVQIICRRNGISYGRSPCHSAHCVGLRSKRPPVKMVLNTHPSPQEAKDGQYRGGVVAG